MTISKLATGKHLARSHGGVFAAGLPRVIVAHCTESPAYVGRALSNAKYVDSQGMSIHYFLDQADTVAGLDETLIGYGAGPRANPIAIHIEFCGYAKWTRAEWLTNGGSMFTRGAALIADIGKRLNIPLVWLTDAQLKAGARGLTTHAQITRVLGGTTHTDPGAGFPKDLLTKGAAAMAALDADKKLTMTDYRGRFTDGSSPKVTKTVEETVANTWEFTKYGAGALDKLLAEVAALRREVAAIKAGSGPTEFTGTVNLKGK